MHWTSAAHHLLAQEAYALLDRLKRLRPFALITPMVPAAGISLQAFRAIETYLAIERRKLRSLGEGYLHWLRGPGQGAPPSEAQRRFTFMRLRFQAVLTQVDIFADVLNQRSEHDTGVWLAGLDAVAEDVLRLPGDYYPSPPVICYLDRGMGAAIRRARTRLPGGGRNPVAIVRIPRERMIGSGIASSLAHEVGHQAIALLDLAASLRRVVKGLQLIRGPWRIAWAAWERWLTEILADFWAVARVGIAAPLGLLAVVSLPRAFVFRTNLEDPHPSPYLRVKLSCQMGAQLYPHPQWQRLIRIWESFYPVTGLDPGRRHFFALLEKTIPALAALVAHHRPPALRGRSLLEVLQVADRTPARLLALWQECRRQPLLLPHLSPSVAFAVLAQAKFSGLLSPMEESRHLDNLLRTWALKQTTTFSGLPAPALAVAA